MNIRQSYPGLLIAVLLGCSEGGTGGTGGITPPIGVSGDSEPPGISLVPLDSTQSFETFIKLGLSQWAGTNNSAQATSLSEASTEPESVAADAGLATRDVF